MNGHCPPQPVSAVPSRRTLKSSYPRRPSAISRPFRAKRRAKPTRDIMPLGKRVQALPGNDFPCLCEINAMQNFLGMDTYCRSDRPDRVFGEG